MFAKKHKTDFCCSQESHSGSDGRRLWRCQWGNDLWMLYGPELSAGVAILKYSLLGTMILSLVTIGHFFFQMLTIITIVGVINHNS